MSTSCRIGLLALGLLLGSFACSPPASNNDAAQDQGASADKDMSASTQDQGSTRDQGTVSDQGTAPDQQTASPDMPAATQDLGVDTGNPGGTCKDTPLYADEDGDGQGAGASVKTECLKDGELPSEAGLVLQAGDCNDEDPLQYEGSSGVCDDNVDDDCDLADEMCPASQPASTLLPNWDCGDATPPANVYAWAKFDQGNTSINPGCFVFFASGKDTFFVQRIGLDHPMRCTDPNGCICRFDGGNGYDQRLYAFTRHSDDTQSCPDIQIGKGQTAVSNSCRKYLYQMHMDSRGYSYAATGVDALKERLALFDTVEVACVKDVTFNSGFPFQSILTSKITLNADFVMPR